jgi:plasmid stabilization system protein ParE
MKICFTREASADVQSTTRFYARLRRGLGVDFVNELHEVVHRLPANPELGPRSFRDCRRLILHRFPHYVIYRIDHEANVIRIIAVIDQRGRPDAWRDRVEESVPIYEVPLAA